MCLILSSFSTLEWWIYGVPKLVRKKVSDRFEEEDGVRGAKEFYFDLIDYRMIAVDNWNIFESILAYEKHGTAKKRTSWMATLNDKRKIVSHISSGVKITIEELNELQEYDRWFETKIRDSQAANS